MALHFDSCINGIGWENNWIFPPKINTWPQKEVLAKKEWNIKTSIIN